MNRPANLFDPFSASRPPLRGGARRPRVHWLCKGQEFGYFSTTVFHHGVLQSAKIIVSSHQPVSRRKPGGRAGQGGAPCKGVARGGASYRSVFAAPIHRQLPLVLVDTEAEHAGVFWKKVQNLGFRTLPIALFLETPTLSWYLEFSPLLRLCVFAPLRETCCGLQEIVARIHSQRR